MIDQTFAVGNTDYVERLNAMVDQINAENASTRAHVDNQVVGMQDIKTDAETAAAQAAASAASAASVVQQDLSAIDQTFLTSTTLVDVCLYDTAKDSDGGAWRQRCSHASWENETLSGNWLGSAANEAAARLIDGATTGSYYYDTTAAVFYKLNAGSGVTQVYRGNARQFPARVLITAESSRLIIWDLTQAGCPMWMVIVSGALNVGSALTSVAAYNALVQVGATGGGTSAIELICDRVTLRTASSYINRTTGTGVAGRATATQSEISATAVIVNNNVNDVAITVLPNALVDVATGLPVPTIAVATDGGVSVVTDAGSVWDITNATGDRRVAFTADQRLCVMEKNSGTLRIGPLPTADIATASWRTHYLDTSGVVPAHKSGTLSAAVAGALGGSAGVTLYHENPATPTASMVAYITKDWASGWLPGDIRGAWLADIVAETVTGAELVTNGDFASGTTGWSAVNSGSIAVASGEITVTNGASNNGTAEQAITTVVGKTYVVSATARVGTTSPVYIVAGTTTGTFGLGSASTTSGSNVPRSFTFTATGTTTYIGLRNAAGNGLTGIYDNVSCRLADPDRSVKAKGMQVFGSLTKAAVASGAQLVGYSGWSAANYLEQPYNSDLDYGTAAFAFLLAAKEAPNSAAETLFERAYYTASAYSGARIRAEILAAGTLKCTFSDGTNSVTLTSTATLDDSVWRAGIIIGYDGTNFRMTYGGADLATPVARGSVGSLTNANAVLRVGLGVDGTLPLTNGALALLRAGATWSSSEQKMYISETEKGRFVAGAQDCLAGTSNAVTALAYDDTTDLLHVGTSYGRSTFAGLVRTTSEATAVGAIRALAAGGGTIAQAGAAGADIYVPAQDLREELARGDEQMAAYGQNLIAHNFEATASQTTFTLPVGWEICMVYAQGALKQEGATKDWTRTYDGFLWSVVFASGRSASDWISVYAARTGQ